MTGDYVGLAERHATYLRDRAVSPEVAAARGYSSVKAPDELAELGFKEWQRRAGLVIPVWSTDAEISLHQLRPDDPRPDPKRSGKRINFEQPHKERTDIDVPPLARGQVLDPTVPLWITEGVPKADAAVSAGLCCIAFLGVWNWQRDGVPFDAWADIPLDGRRVHICYDSDVMTKRTVRSALNRLEQFLLGEDAEVLRITLPGGEGAKVGLDDFLAEHPVERLHDLARKADPEHQEAVEKTKKSLYVRQQAREEYEVEQTVGRFHTLPRATLTEAAKLRLPAIVERVTMLHRVGHNSTITGQYKVGKTTFSGNLVRSLVDGEPFLDRFAVTRPEGRVGYLNYELDEQDFLEWVGDMGIRNTDAVAPLNLRGVPFTLADPRYQDELVAWAQDMNVEVLFLDPFRRAFMGFGKENDNDDVNRFTDTVDELKRRAGIKDVFLSVHTGRMQHAVGEERARGATALDDWTDQRWLLTKDGQHQRYMYADGRAGRVPEFRLVYDEATHRLTGEDGNRSEANVEKTLAQIVALVKEQPGRNRGQLEDALGARKDSSLTRAVREGVSSGQLKVLERGRAKYHFRLEDYPTDPATWKPTEQ